MRVQPTEMTDAAVEMTELGVVLLADGGKEDGAAGGDGRGFAEAVGSVSEGWVEVS